MRCEKKFFHCNFVTLVLALISFSKAILRVGIKIIGNMNGKYVTSLWCIENEIFLNSFFSLASASTRAIDAVCQPLNLYGDVNCCRTCNLWGFVNWKCFIFFALSLVSSIKARALPKRHLNVKNVTMCFGWKTYSLSKARLRWFHECTFFSFANEIMGKECTRFRFDLSIVFGTRDCVSHSRFWKCGFN